jgi:hypothetical protein
LFGEGGGGSSKIVPQGHWQENAQVCQLCQSHSLQAQPLPIFTEKKERKIITIVVSAHAKSSIPMLL